jgi:membrane-bound inhibitor of C-type lysozyme
MSFTGINVIKILSLLILTSCANYTDPEQEKLTYYMCENNHEILVKHSDDYQSIAIRYNQGMQVTLHQFVSEKRSGYSTENLLWLTQGKRAVLVEKFADGTEKVLFKECFAEKMKLQY